MSPHRGIPSKFITRHFPYRPGKNEFARAILRPLLSLLGRTLVDAIPVTGRVTARLRGGHKITMETQGDDVIAAAVYRHGLHGFEGATLDVFLERLSRSRTFLDIGANTGLYSLIAAAARPDLAVHAFEPVPGVCARLDRNIALNGPAGVVVHRLALSDRPGTLPLYVPADDRMPTSASLLQGFRDNCVEIQVPVDTLDNVVRSQQIQNVDLIKIDTEATEHLVLAGATELLGRDRPAIICEVLQGRTERFLQPLLAKAGYRFYQITGRGLVPRDAIEGHNDDPNYLFVHEAEPHA